MAIEDVVGVILIAVTIVISILALVFAKECRWIAATTAFGAFLVPVAIIPQLIKNTKNPQEMEDYIVPWYLIAYPASIVFDMISQLYNIYESHDYVVLCNSWINYGGMVFRLILYTTWLGQYAHHGHYRDALIAITTIFAIASGISVGTAYRIKGRQGGNRLEGKW
jgi:hypothetical protein